MTYDWSYMFGLFLDRNFWRASLLVVELSVLVWVISNIFGIGLALMKESNRRWARWISGLYVWFFRSLPLLVLLVFVFNLPQVLSGTQSILGTAFRAALVAMVLNEAAYMAEIHRGGLLSVGVDQREAASALGLPYRKIQRLVVIPQAFRIALPALGNEFVNILKLTSLASTISLAEILLVGQRLYTQNFLILETLTAVALYYVLLVTIFDGIRILIERRLDVRRRRTREFAGAAAAATSIKRHRPRHPHSGDVVVSLRNVTKSFGEVDVLKNIDLSVHAGEVVVIIGPSGSGKTTLVRTINRLEVVDGGEVQVNGHLVGYRLGRNDQPIPLKDSTTAAQRRDIGMVFQRFNLFPHRTVLHNITMAPTALGTLARADADEKGLELLRRVGLEAHAHKYPYQLSGGQQQRVAIARALALQPSVMLFDEPTSALDPELVGEVLNVIADLAESGMTMVIVTHEMRLARDVADWVVFMEEGRVVTEGPPENVFGSSAEDRVQRFVSMVTS